MPATIETRRYNAGLRCAIDATGCAVSVGVSRPKLLGLVRPPVYASRQPDSIYEDCMLLGYFKRDFAYPPPAAAAVAELLPAFFIDVGRKCNFACPFCSVSRSPSFYPVEDIEQLLSEAGRHDLGTGLFTGGEPSIFPELDRVMEHGARHGVTRYAISTNASGLTDAARVRRWEELGLVHWKLSWDDYRPEVLDRLRGHLRVLELMLEVLEVLSGLERSRISINQVVVRDNYEHVPKMVEYVAKLRERFPRIQWLLVSLVKPVEQALTHPEHLFPYERAVPFLYQAIEIAERAELPLLLNNVPACLIPEQTGYHCSTFEHLGLLDTSSGERFPMRFPEFGLVKRAACLRCREFERCNGYWEEYARAFGHEIYAPTGELVREDPLALDRLDQERDRVEALRQRQLEPEAATARPASPRDVRPATSKQLAELDQVLGHPYPGGWTLERSELCGEEPPFIYRAVFVLGSTTQTLDVSVAPRAAGHRAFRTTQRLSIWYAGTQLTRENEQLLLSLVGRAAQHDACILQLLSI